MNRHDRAYARQAVLHRLWHEGVPVEQIAKRLDTTPPTVRNMCASMRRDGWDLPYRYPHRLGKPAQRAAILTLSLAGLTPTEIGAALKINPGTAHTTLARMRAAGALPSGTVVPLALVARMVDEERNAA